MKTITIYNRIVLERTGYKEHPYQQKKQITIFYNGKEYYNHYENINNPKLRIKFECILKTRSKKDINNYIKTLSKTDTDKWLKLQLENILKEVNE